MFKRAIVGAVLGLALSAGVSAASTVNFVINKAASSVTITNTADGLVCSWTQCGVSAALASGLGGSFVLGDGQKKEFDFITWTGKGSGGTLLEVTAKLAFSEPAGIDTEGHGKGGAILAKGSILAGLLTWTNLPNYVTLADGHKIKIDFEGGAVFHEGASVTSKASVKNLGPSPVPLPPAALLLVGGIGSLGGLRFARRRRAV